MAVYFFDTSALVKRYVAEIGSPWVEGITDPASGNRIEILTITAVEVTSSVARRVNNGTLTTSQRDAIITQFRNDRDTQYRSADVTPTLVEEAMTQAERHALRGYDAIQLAGALLTNRERIANNLPPLTLVSADVELNTAAQAEGLHVEDPNNYP